MTRHWPALDGLRAVAVVAVMIFHLASEPGNPGGPSLLPGGYLGVDVFFVLSGFLITSLLIDEWDGLARRISFRDFYARRMLRLFPALGCVAAAAVTLAWLLGQTRIGRPAHAGATVGGLPWVALFLGNWLRAFGLGDLGLLGHTWSLAVEEQFYLLWPGLFALLSRRGVSRGRLAVGLAAVAMAEMVYRDATVSAYPPGRAYYGTDTHSDGLLLGCAVAFWLSARGADGRRPVEGGPLRAAAWPGAASLAVLFAFGGSLSAISAVVLISAVIVAGLAQGDTPSTLARVLSAKPAVWIGRRSYGLYLSGPTSEAEVPAPGSACATSGASLARPLPRA